MTNIAKTFAVVAAVSVGGVLTAGAASADGFYPDKFQYNADVPLQSYSGGSGIPSQYRVR